LPAHPFAPRLSRATPTIVPIFLSDIPSLFLKRQVPLDMALLQTVAA
jgi:hypothetical protein